MGASTVCTSRRLSGALSRALKCLANCSANILCGPGEALQDVQLNGCQSFEIYISYACTKVLFGFYGLCCKSVQNICYSPKDLLKAIMVMEFL